MGFSGGRKLIQLEANQVFIPGSAEDFKRWLQKRKAKAKPIATKPLRSLAPAHLPRSRSKVNTDELLSIIKAAGRMTAAQVAAKLNIDNLTAGNRIKTLHRQGFVEVVGKAKRRPIYAAVAQPKPIQRTYKASTIRGQVIKYFETHSAGSNADLAQRLRKKDTSNVGPITIRLLLEGVLVAHEVKHPANGKAYRVFSLNKETA